MQSPYHLPHPLPPLPVRKGVRGRRPKSQTIAMLKAAAEAAAAAAAAGHNGPGVDGANKTNPSAQLAPRPHKKRGPKPGSKVTAAASARDQLLLNELNHWQISFNVCLGI